MWEIIFILAMIAVGVVIALWDSNKNGNGASHGSSDRGSHSKMYTSFDADIIRAQRKRDEKKRKKQEHQSREWYDDYETYTDDEGNEHSLDYDNYCDECDDYHEE